MKKLSSVELDAIQIYKHFNHSVELISQELHAPVWYIQNILFRYLNGRVKDDMLIDKQIKPPINYPKRSGKPTQQAVEQALHEIYSSNVKLSTINNKE